MTSKYLYYFIISLLFLGFICPDVKAEEAITWQGCIREAAKNHPDLIAAVETVKQSEAGKKITASALFPQIDSSLTAGTAKTSSSSSGSSTSDTYAYGATASQLIFDGTKTINNVRAASENISAAKQGFRFTSATVRSRLRAAFINLLKAQELLNITQQIYDIRRENLEIITLRYISGLEHKGALLTAEADLANAQYQISQAKRGLVTSQRQLIKELGRKEFTDISVKGDFEVRAGRI